MHINCNVVLYMYIIYELLIELFNNNVITILYSLQDISENGADISHLKTVHEIGVQSGKGTAYKRKSFLGKLLIHEWKVINRSMTIIS